MLKWILIGLGGVLWCVLALLVTLYLTFPSDSVVERLRYEVQKGTGGDIALKASSAAPRWVGLSLADVQVLSVDGNETSRMIAADSITVTTSPWSLLSSKIPVHTVLGLGDGSIVVDADIDLAGPQPRLDRIRSKDAVVGVNTLGALLSSYGVGLKGTGDLKLDIDLEVGKEVKDHDGRISAKGKDITLTASFPDPISGSGTFELGPVQLSELELVVDIKRGRVAFKKADLQSDHGDLSLDGEIVLNDKMGRSRIRANATLAHLGGQLETFAPLMSAAERGEGEYRYTIACTFERMNASCFRPERSRAAAPPRRPVVQANDNAGTSDGGATAGPSNDNNDAERLAEERRKAREERLAERRARIESAGSQPQRPSDDALYDDEEDLPEDDEEGEPDGPPDLDMLPVDRDMLVPPQIRLDPAGLALPPEFEE